MLTCKEDYDYDIVSVCMVKDSPSGDNPEPVTSEDLANSSSRIFESLSYFGIIFMAILVAFFIISFVFRSYQVDGTSMLNTLQNGDKLIIWKVPRSWSRLTGNPYIPKRGDIVVFTESNLQQFDTAQNTKQLIKRVIGLPGERIVAKDGHYTIYNSAHPNGFNPDTTLKYYGSQEIPTTTCSNVCDVTLGPHQIYVSGDNRPDSLDSRFFGPIDANQIIGKLFLRVFPVNHSEVF
jgi:signal peptidase I